MITTMTKTQVEVITSVQRRRSWPRARRSGLLLRRWSRARRFGGCPRGWDPYQPIVSLAPAARDKDLRGHRSTSDDHTGSVETTPES